jgi:hypothetical protein
LDFTQVDAALVAKQRDEVPGPGKRRGVGGRHHVHDPGAARVWLGAAEPGHVHVLAGHAPHHVGAGDEDPALPGQDDHVGQGGTVGGAAGRRAEHHRDLRHHAGRPGHRGEHRTDRVQALHALAEPGAARVPQPDHGGALRERLLVRGHDRRAPGRAHRAALHPRVAGERDSGRAVDLADGRDRPAGVLRRQQPGCSRVEQRPEPDLGVAVDHGGPAVAVRARGRGGLHVAFEYGHEIS